jgi:hypothetical protein
MGGGGGSGQQNNSVGTAGQAGGGIVIIKGNSLTTSCSGSVKISANGVAGTTSGNDGAGGGGAGGTVALQFNTFTVPSGCPLNLQANGGNGGNVGDANAHGGGGGGGQGAVVYSGALPGSNMTTTTTVGTGGLNSSSSGAVSAGNGGGTSNSGIITTSIALMVDFISFDAQRSGNEVMLNWATAESDQHVSFNVQRSSGGAAFYTIGSVFSNSDASSVSNYSFTDQNPLAGKNYYRIEEIDISGKIIYGDINLVDMNSLTNSFSIFPNPSSGQFSIRLAENTNLPLLLTIADLAGKTVYEKTVQVNGSIIPVTMERTLATGMYIIMLKSNAVIRTAKLLIK